VHDLSTITANRARLRLIRAKDTSSSLRIIV
jgi:hypothetical protein